MLTAQQLADALGVHPNWVYHHAASGELPSYKVGAVWRFAPAEVAAWLTTRQPVITLSARPEPRRGRRRASRVASRNRRRPR